MAFHPHIVRMCVMLVPNDISRFGTWQPRGPAPPKEETADNVPERGARPTRLRAVCNRKIARAGGVA